MPSYLVEIYLSRRDAGRRSVSERRARSAAEEQTRKGTRVRFDGSIYVPEDEICFFSFEAPSDADVVLVAQRAGLDGFRVVEADLSRKEILR